MVATLHESMIVIQTLMLDGLMPSVDILKIDCASASVNEKLKASTGTAHRLINLLKKFFYGESIVGRIQTLSGPHSGPQVGHPWYQPTKIR